MKRAGVHLCKARTDVRVSEFEPGLQVFVVVAVVVAVVVGWSASSGAQEHIAGIK